MLYIITLRTVSDQIFKLETLQHLLFLTHLSVRLWKIGDTSFFFFFYNSRDLLPGWLYLAVVLSFVLQHLLQVQAAGQVALGQVVAELGDTEQALLCHHCFTARQKREKQINA